MNMRRYTAVAVSLLLVLGTAALLAAGCGDSQASAEEQLRMDLEGFKTSLQMMTNPAIYTDSEQLKQATDDLSESFDKVVASAGKVKDIRVNDLEAAYKNLEEAVAGFTGEGSLSEKTTAITSALDELDAAWNQMFSDLGGK
ncbi:MAG: hypothetical protein V1748_09895 [Actinomycetota bacterium]